MTPAVVPRSGRVVITGQVTNRSDETWTDLKTYLFTSAAPITTRSELAEAAATDEDAPIGTRVYTAGLYDEVSDLAPGEATSYRLSVPAASLGIGSEPGVYWIGVHVLGAPEGEGRDNIADGRARTFIPQVPRDTDPSRLALVIPVKDVVRRGAAGRLLGLSYWQQSLSADGRLDRLLNLSGRAAQPITWVVDPAVLDAARSVAQDNPKVDPGPGEDPGGTDDPSGSADPSPSGSGTPSEGGSGSGDDNDDDVGPAAEPSSHAVAARAWLEELLRQAPTHTVTAVPYGDLDVASVLSSRRRALYQRAAALSAETMTGFGIERATPVVDPISKTLPASALRRVEPSTPVVLGGDTFPDAQQPVVARDGRAPVVLADTGAGSGGPKPNSRYAALAVRQRVLADAALHALSSDKDQPLVVSTPPYWNPGSNWNDADFFAGLDQPWLQMVDLTSVVNGAAPARPETGPVYPKEDRKAEIPRANLSASARLDATGQTYGRLLTDNDTVEDQLARVAILASSENTRDDAGQALARVESTTGYVRAQMQSVRIEGPDFVMMSSEDGPIQVTLVNGLDQPVRVGITARTRSTGLKIASVAPRTLGPGQRTAIRLRATSNNIGVHAVTLVATDDTGHPTGSITQFSVRTSRVSTVIWVIMASGGVLLFLAIAVRLFRRVRRRKSTHGPRLTRGAPGSAGQELGA